LDAEGGVKLSDFGVIGWMVETGESAARHKRCKTLIGEPRFMAPEVLQQTSGYNTKADIWSVGITAIELATGHAPYSDAAPFAVLAKTLHGPPPTVPPPRAGAFSRDFHEFVAMCLEKDPEKRPTATELLGTRFL